jgi:cytochrome bd-type quinol oxidase subunit 2
MITVDSCLCFKLETGGLIIGWLCFIGYILVALMFAVILILLCVFSCSDFAEQLDSASLDLCQSFHGVFIGLAVVVIALCIGFAYIAWRCIQGTRTRDHFKIKPMMIMLGIVTVLSALQIFSLTTTGIVNGLIELVVNAYFFVVIYSLYDMFRREFESGGNRHNLQYQVAGKV